MPVPPLRKPLKGAPSYPVRGAARRALAGIGATALLGGGLLAGCGFEPVDEMSAQRMAAAAQAVPDSGTQPLVVVIPVTPDAGQDAGQPPAPDAGDFFAGGAPYPGDLDGGGP